jgi:hypothetical protein
MATRSKPEKNPLFTVQYWDRQTASEKGDPNGDMIAQAVGYALSESELADQALSELFVTMTECTTSVTYNVVRRAYGSIESNSGRRNAIMAAAEVYFGAYWDNKFVRQFLVDIINAVQWASRRRDDIAHGIIWAGIKIDNVLRLRDSRSSLAMQSLALCLRQAASAFCSSGRALRLPLSISVCAATSLQGPPFR